jgi:hypothetical protein
MASEQYLNVLTRLLDEAAESLMNVWSQRDTISREEAIGGLWDTIVHIAVAREALKEMANDGLAVPEFLLRRAGAAK